MSRSAAVRLKTSRSAFDDLSAQKYPRRSMGCTIVRDDSVCTSPGDSGLLCMHVNPYEGLTT